MAAEDGGSATPRTDLAERATQQQQIDAAIENAASGLGAVVYIEGSRGLGKTALLRWALHRARGHGLDVFAVTARETERADDFGVVRQLLDDAGLSAVDLDARKSVRQLLDVARSKPVLLAVDDLQWVDAPSLRA